MFVENSELHKEYYDLVLDGITPEKKSHEIVFMIIDDISDRGGLSNELDSIDNDIQEEICKTWIEIIENILNN